VFSFRHRPTSEVVLLPSGMAHLPPDLARQQNPRITFLKNRRCVPTPEAVRWSRCWAAKRIWITSNHIRLLSSF